MRLDEALRIHRQLKELQGYLLKERTDRGRGSSMWDVYTEKIDEVNASLAVLDTLRFTPPTFEQAHMCCAPPSPSES